ncbi:hypothetical protein [Streptomyces glaucus]|uniref:Uncharacterized protein n=1 Tax=Streptomyces glaucus TaxID=284029 RepID=A0ABP5WMX1_9ACTN
MTTATFTPAPGRSGATVPRGGHPHRLGDALRAVRVFLGATFDVIALGEHRMEAGVHRR